MLGWALRLCLCLSLCVLAAPARDSANINCSQKADRFLSERLAVWQRRLKLADWKISIRTSHSTDLRPNTLGNIHWKIEEKVAVIRVLDTSDYHVGCRQALEDMEFTVVHELIHLELSSLQDSEASRQEEEYAVNRITRALLLLDRGK